MITGQLPFKGEHEAAVIYSIVNETPEPLARYKANVPEGLQRIADKALSKDANTRYQTVADIVADLKGLLKETTTAALVPPQKKRIRNLSIAYISIAVVIVVAGYAVLSRFFLPSGTEPASLERKSIAVLPFKNMVSDPENEWFSDGITEDIMTQLSKIGDLKVISRTSVMLYKESKKTLRETGQELGVATILEGSVRRADSRVRIISQLVDARTDEHIWAETYDREMKDIFYIQSDVAQKIAIALKAKLSPEEKERLQKKPTENPTAYDYYLKGREYYYRYRKQDNENAIQLFKKALELDPDYALAYAGLGTAYVTRATTFEFTYTWWDSAIDVSQKAISIDPNCAEGYLALGYAYWAYGWLNRALEAYEKAVDLNPNYYPALAGIGSMNSYMGKFDEALKWEKKAIALNPRYVQAHQLVGWAYMGLDDYAKAELWFKKALELQPDHVRAHNGLIHTYLAQEKNDQATAQIQEFLSIAPDDLRALSCAGFVELISGNYAEAKQHYEKELEILSRETWAAAGILESTRLGYIYWKTDQQQKARKMFRGGLNYEEKFLAQGDEMWDPPYNIAAINAIQGNKKEAYLWLQKAIDAGWRDYRIASIDPVFEKPSRRGAVRTDDG
jgi:TolB-like protein/Flp pilus assembly protein TadD